MVHRRTFRQFGFGVFAMVLLLVDFTASAQVVFQDMFANRQTITATNGTLTGDNLTATVQVGEPQTGGKPGGHSVWVSFLAPTNGVATFDTHGSSFDTLMSAYTLQPGGSNVNQLHEEARNDDDFGFQPTSLIQIGAIAGQHYEIAIDGYQGATGSIVMNWSFQPSAAPPPIIISTPNSFAAKLGDPVTLTVNMTTSPQLQLNWYLNGVEQDQTGTNYVITNLQATNIGTYQLRVTIGSGNNRVRFFTTPVELQVNSDGSTNTLAEDKLLDSTSTPLIGGEDFGGGSNGPTPLHATSSVGFKALTPSPAIGVVRGYSGSQIFNTTIATTDPAEPLHCSVVGGASYWLMYQPPTNAVVTFDTIGSTYDTVMEIYTFNGTLASYADLISVGCDNDAGLPNGASQVSYQAVNTRSYVIVVDGVNGARGTAWLNYSLDTNQPAQPPHLQQAFPTQTVSVGANLTLWPTVTGAPPMVYSWAKDGIKLTNATFPFLQLTNITMAQTGAYSLLVSNDLGPLTVQVPVHVVPPTQCDASVNGAGLNIGFQTVANYRYTVLQSSNIYGPWLQWAPPFIGDGKYFSTNISSTGSSFYRVRIE